MSESAHLIVTGSRGRIGRAIMAHQRWHVRPLSRVADENHGSLDDFLRSTTPLQADVLIHCAWSTVPVTAEADPDANQRCDLPLVDGLIARLLREANPPLLIFMSTGAVYGPAVQRPSTEADIPNPIGHYARGKLAAEQRLLASGLPVCVLRVGNVYGMSSEAQQAQGVIARLVRGSIARTPVPRWGGNSVKDYLHCRDFVTALDAIISRKLTSVFNVGTGSGTCLSKVIALIESISGHALSLFEQPAPAWDVADNRIDITKLQQACGWRPRITIEEGIRLEFERARGDCVVATSTPPLALSAA